jgi:hypothetical protein
MHRRFHVPVVPLAMISGSQQNAMELMQNCTARPQTVHQRLAEALVGRQRDPLRRAFTRGA